MLVSIIMPAFNRERYLASAIESVLGQTLPNWELIVVDDGSSDSTPEIAASFQDKCPDKIHLLRQKNSGVAAARNAGIRASRGSHIAFLDSDDTWEPTKLELQSALFRRKARLAFVYTGYLLTDEHGGVTRTVAPDPSFRGNLSERLWLEDNTILGATLLVPRETLFDVGLFDTRLRGAENLDLRIKLASRGDVDYVDKPLYRYRKHRSTLTENQELMIEQHRSLIEAHFGARSVEPAREDLRRRVMARHWKMRADYLFAQGRFGEARGYYLDAWSHYSGKCELAARVGRCFLGTHGNHALRSLKNLVSSR